MLLPLKLESLGQYNTNQDMFEENCTFDQIVDKSNILKTKLFYYFLLILSMAFVVAIQC